MVNPAKHQSGWGVSSVCGRIHCPTGRSGMAPADVSFGVGFDEV